LIADYVSGIESCAIVWTLAMLLQTNTVRLLQKGALFKTYAHT
jgi:hypothetical protein